MPWFGEGFDVGPDAENVASFGAGVKAGRLGTLVLTRLWALRDRYSVNVADECIILLMWMVDSAV